MLLIKALHFLPTAREGNIFRSVCHSVHGGGGGGGWTASAPGGRPPELTSSGGHCSGQYTSYWNAFLFILQWCFPSVRWSTSQIEKKQPANVILLNIYYQLKQNDPVGPVAFGPFVWFTKQKIMFYKKKSADYKIWSDTDLDIVTILCKGLFTPNMCDLMGSMYSGGSRISQMGRQPRESGAR